MNADPFPSMPAEYSRPEKQVKKIPLVVDLDGTLVATDMFGESVLALIKHNPLAIFAVLFWLLLGRAYAKRQLGQRATVDLSVLPFHRELLDYLKDQRARGRMVVMATASDVRLARQIADYLGIFDMVFASDGRTNLAGSRKRERLVAEFGEKNFDYAGNARRDLAVWSAARRAILVNPSRRLSRRAAKVTEIERVFREREGWLWSYLRALRLHHWLKNLLLFVPLVLAQRFSAPDLLANVGLAFIAFGLCASSVYLINDMLDLEADRHHPEKRRRPFAAGTLSLAWGFGSVPLLLMLSLGICGLLPPLFLAMVEIYFILNLAYSFFLKRLVILDVTVLAILYTMRIMAGAVSVGIWPSDWLLAFSTFLFLSLALVKRFDELATMRALSGNLVQVRGYRVADQELLSSMGTVSGYVAVLVLVIYISSGAARVHYTRYYLIWFLCPLLLYWISYVWLVAHRGEMSDDPLVFTLRDQVSRVVLLLIALILLVAM